MNFLCIVKDDTYRTTKDWGVGKIIPLFKKDITVIVVMIKRSILLGVVLKAFERIIEKRVRDILDRDLEKSQSSFRKETSCHRSHFYIKTNIGNIHAYNKNCIWVSLIYKKAFET